MSQNNTLSKQQEPEQAQQQDKSFVTEKDYQVFRDNQDDLEKCIQAFQKDMPAFLRQRWREEYERDIQDFQTAEEPLTFFNKMIGSYPSTAGDAILDDLFTFVKKEHMDLLSEDTRQILSYFYNMLFHSF